ncbi:MAG: alpha/beta hydrolase [bacterium]
MKKQIVFIRGGETFANKADFYEYISTVSLDPYKQKKSWRDWIIEVLKDEYDFLSPVMPSKQDADYKAWKIWFERHFDFIKNEDLILIGSSLGATFLLKYLSENNFPKKILQLHLVVPAVFNDGLTLEKLNTFEFDIKKINKISEMCDEIYLWASKDDPLVSFENSEMVKENLPNVKFNVFENRGHFFVETFPEILEIIKKVK